MKAPRRRSHARAGSVATGDKPGADLGADNVAIGIYHRHYPADHDRSPTLEVALRGKPGSSWQIHVNASPGRTFDYVAALDSHPEWAMEQMTVAPEGSGPATVGSRYQIEGTLFNKRQRATVTVTELAHPLRFAFESAGESSIIGHVFTFTPYGGGTLVTHQIFAIKQPLVGSLMLRARHSAVDAGFNRQLSKMRSNVESAAGTSAHPVSATHAPRA